MEINSVTTFPSFTSGNKSSMVLNKTLKLQRRSSCIGYIHLPEIV